MFRSTRRIAAIAAFVALCMQCKEPTQATLIIRTNVPCNVVKASAVSAGSLGTTESAVPAITTPNCSRGFVGSLVLIPKTAKDARISVRVTMALDTSIEQCTRQNKYLGCIVARRIVRYVAGSSITLPINMYLACKDVPCNETSTCSIAGKCISAELDRADCTTDDGCFLPGDVNLDPTRTPDDPQRDGGDSADGGDGEDASPDGQRDGSNGTGGDGGATTTGRVACASFMNIQCGACCSGLTAMCVDSSQCETSRFDCDQPGDCLDAMNPECCRYDPAGGGGWSFSRCRETCFPEPGSTPSTMCRTAADCTPTTGRHCDYRDFYGSCQQEAQSQNGIVCPDANANSRCAPGMKCCLRTTDEFPRGACVQASEACDGAEAFTCDDDADCLSAQYCAYLEGRGASCSRAVAYRLCNRGVDCPGGVCNFGAVYGLYGVCDL